MSCHIETLILCKPFLEKDIKRDNYERFNLKSDLKIAQQSQQGSNNTASEDQILAISRPLLRHMQAP